MGALSRAPPPVPELACTVWGKTRADPNAIALAAPTSRVTADLAICLHYIEGASTCCGSCGGAMLMRLPSISGVPPKGRPPAPPRGWNGTITAAPKPPEALPFSAQHVLSTG